MKKILITGGSGVLGSNLAFLISSYYKVVVQYYNNFANINNCQSIKLNLLNKEEIKNYILKELPEVVIHTAALTNPDYCEEHKEEAYLVNTEATKAIALACQRIDAKFIFLSTDLVFGGEKSFYKEEDTVAPLSYYAKTKVWAEEYILSLDLDYTIIRTAVLYGFGNSSHLSFSDWLLQGFLEHKERKLFIDQYRSPILVNNLVRCIMEIIEKDLKGLYHIGGSQKINRYDFGRIMADIFKFNSDLLIPIKAETMNFKAKRPVDCSLNIESIKRDLNTKILDVQEGIDELRSLYLNNYQKKKDS
ncbi:MAG: SDR family oxidoreductase [bacterium]|nr:SDR family oxidoreductase [bacterium]